MKANEDRSKLDFLVYCDLCGESLTTAEYLFSNHGYSLIRCRSCGLVLTQPRPVRDEILAHYPHDYYTHVGRMRPNIKSRLRFRLMTKLGGYPSANESFLENMFFSLFGNILKSFVRPIVPYKKGGRLLDVGCGNGHFLFWATSVGWDTYGVDIDEKAVEIAKRHGHRVFLGTLEEASYSDTYFDVVTLLDVLEHCHDPLQVLRECHRILKEDGLLIASVPNFSCYDRRVFRENWIGIDCPRHLFHFTPVTIKKLFQKTGFQVDTVLYRIWFSISENESYNLLQRSLHCPKGRGQFLQVFQFMPQILFLKKVIMCTLGAPEDRLGVAMTVYARKIPGRD